MTRLTFLLKALNEEAHIGACLKSILCEIEGLEAEIVLVDSLSADRTVDVARAYPVKVLQFASPEDRGCAAAVQLGYQCAGGEFLYVIDGDMTLEPGFLSEALAYLEKHPDVAGVGGLLSDNRIRTAADRRRVDAYGGISRDMTVADLGGGGLYRRSAVESAGYLAHRWLPACEEAELGVRLRAAGWRLVRLARPAVRHTGHDETDVQMLRRLWRSGRMAAYGMFLRSAVGTRWWWPTVRRVRLLFVAPVLHLSAAVAAALLAFSCGYGFAMSLLVAEAAIWVPAFVLMSVRKRSPRDAAVALCAWHLYAAAGFLGVMRPLPSPNLRIDFRELT